MKRMGNVVSALSILFVFYAFLKIDFDKIQIRDPVQFLVVCMAGLAVKMFTVPCMGFAWLLWLEAFLGRRCRRREALHVYIKANIGKYVPGNVMHYVERNLFAENLGLPQSQLAAASLLEIVCLLLAGLLFGGIFFRDFGWSAVFISMSVMAVVLGLLWFFFLYRDAERDGKKEVGHGEKSDVKCNKIWVFRTFLRCFAIYGMVLALLGFVLLLLYCYEQGRLLGFGSGIKIISAYIMAWAAGFVVPGAPGGMGVRELVLLMLLTPVMGKDTIVQLCILHRLITVVGDFLMFFLENLLYSKNA